MVNTFIILITLWATYFTYQAYKDQNYDKEYKIVTIIWLLLLIVEIICTLIQYKII